MIARLREHFISPKKNSTGDMTDPLYFPTFWMNNIFRQTRDVHPLYMAKLVLGQSAEIWYLRDYALPCHVTNPRFLIKILQSGDQSEIEIELG